MKKDKLNQKPEVQSQSDKVNCPAMMLKSFPALLLVVSTTSKNFPIKTEGEI